MAATPCGLSFQETVDIIKTKVLTGNYNGRQEVMQGLLDNNYTYSEAKEVTDYYFKVYNRLSESYKNSKPNVILTPEQKRQKQLNNIAVNYLNGKIGGVPVNDNDADHLQAIYEKVANADTPTLKEKYNEEASIFMQKFMPGYANEIFKTSVYARPLLSAVFFVKSLTSNLHAQLERYITNSLYDGKKMDFTTLSKFSDLANASMSNVLSGGIPATSLYQSEANIGWNKGRVEEFSLKGTDADGNKLKAGYFWLMKLMSKWSNRFNAAPDTRGIFSNAERHMYQLLKEKYRELGNDEKTATQNALQDMELDDRQTAINMAVAKFQELGLETTKKNGKYTSELLVAASEYQRIHRDEDIWAKALQLSKNDFWKRNMTAASEMGFGDYGIFGLKAQAFSAIRDKLEKHSKNKLASAFNLYAFGFINGAANFAEDAIERMPLYALVKLLFLQNTKGKTTDAELQRDISRRQKDIIVKNFLTVAFFLASKMAEKMLCPDREGKVDSGQISSGRTQIGPCGIPVLVPPQMMAMYKMYSIIDNFTDNDEEFFDTVLNVLPVLAQSNQVGLGGSIDKLGEDMANYGVAAKQGNEVKMEQYKVSGLKSVTRMGADMANSFLPIPSRLMAEVGVAVQKGRGVTQKQQDLPFAINEKGNPLSFLRTLGKVSVANLGNVTGVSEIMIAAKGSNKNYSVDWQGRKVAQFRGSDIVGNGIQYNRNDDVLAEAGVKAPYVSRLQNIEYEETKEEKKGFLNRDVELKTKKVRFMTDEEYFNVSRALGDFNKAFMDENGDEIIEVIKSDKVVAAKQLDLVFRASKKAALEALEKEKGGSYEEILDYVNKKWNTKKNQIISQTTF